MSETTINDASELRIVDIVDGKEVDVGANDYSPVLIPQKPIKEKINDKNQA